MTAIKLKYSMEEYTTDLLYLAKFGPDRRRSCTAIKFQNLVKIAVFWRFCRSASATVYTDKSEIWRDRVVRGYTLAR